MKVFDAQSLRELEAMLARRVADEIDHPASRRACVVAPLLETGGEWSLIFLRRAATLALHSGQIAFPGGAAEEGELLEEAALREVEEEIAIPATSVRLIGRLDDVVTHTGFVVAPFVGVVAERIDYLLQPEEVVEVFEVPLAALLAPGNPDVRYVTYRGGSYPTYFYRYQSIEIWGLTGRIVKGFLDLVQLTL